LKKRAAGVAGTIAVILIVMGRDDPDPVPHLPGSAVYDGAELAASGCLFAELQKTAPGKKCAVRMIAAEAIATQCLGELPAIVWCSLLVKSGSGAVVPVGIDTGRRREPAGQQLDDFRVDVAQPRHRHRLYRCRASGDNARSGPRRRRGNRASRRCAIDVRRGREGTPEAGPVITGERWRRRFGLTRADCRRGEMA
jgi:hypothetical protein